MKLVIDLNLAQKDTGFLKGEDLDSELTSQIENLELDGWEVSSVDIRRAAQKAPSSLLKDNLEAVLQILKSSQIDSISRLNPKFTSRELAVHLIEDALKRV